MTSSRSPRRQPRIDRRALLQGSAAVAGSSALISQHSAVAGQEATPVMRQSVGDFDLMDVTVANLRAGLDNGDFTIRELVRASLDQVAALDLAGPELHAVIELNPVALEIADALDAELAEGASRGPLHGIPVLLKDNIATADGMENTAGSLALEGAIPIKEAFVAERLREAGAVILGKTNLSEWANIRAPGSSSGWSGRGGQVRNPHQTGRTPSGSSSGSAAGVAAGYAPISLGTETDGSVVSPANANGVVGIKPTVGLTSRMGVIPISHNQDTVGTFGRTVTDAALALTAIAVPDPDDPAVSSQSEGAGATPEVASPVASPGASPVAETARPSYPRRPQTLLAPIDYTSAETLDANGLRGARLGVWRERTGYDTEADAVFEESLKALTAAGAELVDPVEMPSAEELASSPDELQVMLWELKPGVAAYIEGYVDPSFPVRTLADVVAFNEEHADEELLWFGQEFLVQSVEKSDLSDPEYVATVARSQRRGREDGIDAVLAQYEVDAIIAPTGQIAYAIDLITGDNWKGASSTAAAVAGYPIVSVPAGSRFGLPLNLSFIGTAFSEPLLIRFAYAFEQATQARIVPALVGPLVVPPVS